MKGISQLPYLIIYDVKGARVKDIVGVDLATLDATLGSGPAPR